MTQKSNPPTGEPVKADKKNKKKTIWQLACEYEAERRGGMLTVFNFLLSLHATTDAAKKDLSDAWQRYEEQMAGGVFREPYRSRPNPIDGVAR